MDSSSILKSNCANGLLDLNELPPIQEGIKSCRLQRIDTITQLPKNVDGGSLEFLVDPSLVESACLYQSFFEFKIKVVKLDNDGNEKDLEAIDLVSYVNFMPNTMIRNVSVSIADEELTAATDVYFPYESYVSALYHLSSAGQKNILGSGACWYPDTPGTFDEVDPRPNETTGQPLNEGLARRHNLTADSKVTTFVSPLLHPLFLVPKLLPTKTDLRITLHLQNSEFCFTAYKPTQAPLPRYRIKVMSSALYLQRYRLTPEAQVHQERMLADGAKYPLQTLHTSTFVIPSGADGIIRPITIASAIPSFVYIGFVKKKAFDGAIYLNSLRFVDCDLAELFLELDGEKFPSGLSYKPNYATKDFALAYKQVRSELNYSVLDLAIDANAWESGYTVYPFSLLADRSLGCDYISPPEHSKGQLNVNIKFRKDLEEPVVAVVICETPRLLELDSNRKPKWI